MVGRFYYMLMLRVPANVRLNINNCFSHVRRRLLYRHRPHCRRRLSEFNSRLSDCLITVFKSIHSGCIFGRCQNWNDLSVALRQGKEHRAYVYIEIKKNEIHIHTQKLYFILIKPPNTLNWNPKQTQISFNNQITYFFFYLEAIYSRQFITERDESHARLVLLCLNSFLLSPFQRVDLGQVSPLNLLPLPLISDFIRRGMDESLLTLALCLFTWAKHLVLLITIYW